MAPAQLVREIVTVARDGSKTANCGSFTVPVYTTAVYRAVRRVRDGVETWRRVSSVRCHSTSGKGVSGAMTRRAQEYAQETGREFAEGIRHGDLA